MRMARVFTMAVRMTETIIEPMTRIIDNIVIVSILAAPVNDF